MVTAIIAAGGRGARMGGDRPKQLLSLGGVTILQRSVDAFDRCRQVDEIVLVVPPELATDSASVFRPEGTPVRVVAGGTRRQDSVARGFDASSLSSEIIVVHDAARPLCPTKLIVRTIEAAARHGAAIAALPAQDTVKQRAVGDDRFVGRTLARQCIVLAQTPQAFRREVLAEAVGLGRRGVEATDEAVLAERAGHRVVLVAGDPMNIKITTERDLSIARRLLGETMAARVGFGYDLHRLVEGRPLVLGGVRIPHDRGLAGHSDADAVCHAVADAILGAAAAGDIGRHFPDTDPRWKGASSIELLRAVVDLVRSRGFVVVNLDVVVVAERPRIGLHTEGMCKAVASAVGVEPDAVSIKGKTNEGVDAIGRGEASATHAVALLRTL
jgi:2-C-methyl-D-erythritol 4-phosphate cytidylyltransferase/2-C-methyl-D-erythritol 2,4-cyclodiphosphate synthase